MMDVRPLIEAATKAASSHNTQPWRFFEERGAIRIAPDFSRRCPRVDPDDHHLYVSLGCAAENLVVAASARGLAAEVAVAPAPTGAHEIEVALGAGTIERSPLVDAIDQRQCTRAAYDERKASAETLRALERADTGDGVSVLLVTDAPRMATVAELVATGNERQIGDKAWLEELIAWMRFNEAEAIRYGDGLWSKCAGNPNVPRAFGKLYVRAALTPKAQNAKDVPWIQSSAGLAIFVSERDDPRHWIEAGRCYQRFALEATRLGLRNAFVNQPVEVPDLRAQLSAWLGLGAERPDLVVRFGYGPAMPRSKRRPVDTVLLRGGSRPDRSERRQAEATT